MISWAALCWVLACVRPEATDTPPSAPVAAPAPAEPPAAPAAPELPPGLERLAATDVRVAWRGAVGAPASVTRDEAEARALADAIYRRVLAGEPIEALAREHSDDPSGPRGGHLGAWRVGLMVPEYEAALAAVPVGGVTAPVRTPFGWHVARRDPVD